MRPAAGPGPGDDVGPAVAGHVADGHAHAAAERRVVGEEARGPTAPVAPSNTLTCGPPPAPAAGDDVRPCRRRSRRRWPPAPPVNPGAYAVSVRWRPPSARYTCTVGGPPATAGANLRCPPRFTTASSSSPKPAIRLLVSFNSAYIAIAMFFATGYRINLETDALHIPDGFVSAPVARWLRRHRYFHRHRRSTDQPQDRADKAAPLMGVLAAFIFAAQMINFPVAGGTSGHLLGGTLAAILLGPWAAIIAMASVVSVQALRLPGRRPRRARRQRLQHGRRDGAARLRHLHGRYTLAAKRRQRVRLGGDLRCRLDLGYASLPRLTSVQLAISGTSASRRRPAGDARRACADRHRRGTDHSGAVALVQSARPDLLEDADQSPVAAARRHVT